MTTKKNTGKEVKMTTLEEKYASRALGLIGELITEDIDDCSFLEIKGVNNLKDACLYIVNAYFDKNFEAIDDFKYNDNW